MPARFTNVSNSGRARFINVSNSGRAVFGEGGGGGGGTTTTTTTTSAPIYSFSNSGYSNVSVGSACSDASNNRTVTSTCSTIASSCPLFTNPGGTSPLTGYSYVVVDGTVYDVNSTTGVVIQQSATQC
jgi:hypothetical protein